MYGQGGLARKRADRRGPASCPGRPMPASLALLHGAVVGRDSILGRKNLAETSR